MANTSEDNWIPSDFYKEYLLVETPTSFDSAQSICQNKGNVHKKVDLVSIRNEAENDFIWKTFGQKGATILWIGARKTTMSSFGWVSGATTMSDYNNWAPNARLYGDNYCAVMNETDSSWRDISCETSTYYVCEHRIPMDTVLDQIYAKLNKQGAELIAVKNENRQLKEQFSDLSTMAQFNKRHVET